MSFFGMPNLFNDGNEDPFQRSNSAFGQMDQLMNSMMGGQDMFNSFPSIMGPMGGIFRPITNGQRPMNGMGPMAGALSPFGNMGNIMEQFGNDGNCQSFSSSSVMTVSTGPDGRPQMYQASSSSKRGPGGVHETQKSEIDGRQGTRKMEIGHHINDRGHVIEKKMDSRGDMEENQEYINLDEEEAQDFDKEFRQKSQQFMAAPSIGHRPHHRHHRAVNYSPEHPYMPAIAAPPSRASNQERSRKPKGSKTKRNHQQ